MKYLIFDTETIPNQALPADCAPQFDESEVKVGNIKDPAKIAAKMAEERAKFDQAKSKTMSIDPALCQLCTFASAVYDSESGQVEPCVEYQLTDKDHHDDYQAAYLAWQTINDAYTQRMPIVSFNGISFDLPVIWFRMMVQDIPANLQTYRTLTAKYTNKYHYDVMQILAGWDRQKWHKLDFYTHLFGVSGKTMSGADVYPAYQTGEYDRIKEYCMTDVMALAQVFRQIAPWTVIETNDGGE